MTDPDAYQILTIAVILLGLAVILTNLRLGLEIIR